MHDKEETFDSVSDESPKDTEGCWEKKSLASVDEAILAQQNMAVDTGSYIAKLGRDGVVHQVKESSEKAIVDPADQILTPNFFGRPLESMIDSTREGVFDKL